jgi:acyl-CoA thioesterase FadM
MDLTFERAYRVASHTAGPNGLIRPSALLGFLEDAAGEHAATWHLSFADLAPRGLMWVLTRHHLRLLRPPRYGEEIVVTTWPSARRGRVALRDFEVHGHDGELLALATTAWAVLDAASRRLRPISDVVPAGFVLDRRAIPDEFEPLPALPAGALTVPLPVMLRDLDMNRHVNHAVYVQWALEAVPFGLLEGGPPAAIEIAYLAEARLGDRIDSTAALLSASDGSTSYAHRISLAESGRELARLRTTWHGQPEPA